MKTKILYSAVPSQADKVHQLLLTLPDVQQRLALTFRPRRKAQFVAGRALIMRYLDAIGVSDYDIQEHDNSGPTLTIQQQLKHISISHTSSLAAVAFADSSIGLDIETIRDGWSAEKARLFCTDSEVDTGVALPKSQQDEFFTRCWVRKEAFSKQRGWSVWSKHTKATDLLQNRCIFDFELTASGKAFTPHLAALYTDEALLESDVELVELTLD